MKKATSIFLEYFQIFIGTVFAGIGLKAFLLPNGFLDGGFTGIAILLATITDISMSVWLLCISIPFVVFSLTMVSSKIVVKSVVAIAALALFIQLENFQMITDDKLLISIFGGIFLGLGIGLAIKNGAVLDASEILGIFINERFGIRIGSTILFFNIVLFAITAFVISEVVAMYSVLTYVVTAKVIDFMIEGFEDYAGLMIISNHFEELEQALEYDQRMGFTVYQGKRGYGKRGLQEKMDIIHLVVNRVEIRKTYNLIKSVDPAAFIIEFDVNNVTGGVLSRYMNKKGIKKLRKMYGGGG